MTFLRNVFKHIEEVRKITQSFDFFYILDMMQLIVLHIDTIAMKSTEPGFGCRRMNHSQLTNHFLFQMVWSSQVTELGSMRLPTGVPRLLIVGVGRGREDSQLVAIREAAKRISLPVTQVGPLVMLQHTIISNYRR